MSHRSMSGSLGRAVRGEMSDLIRSRQSRQAECGHVGAILAERGGSEDGGTLVWSTMSDGPD